jgi:fructose-1,6-bisphosphatase
MWEHRNDKLHNVKLETCRKMKAAAVDTEIEKLYARIQEVDAEDRWRFNTPLMVQLKKPLQLKRRWLVLTKMLVDKSIQGLNGGQREITDFFARGINNDEPNCDTREDQMVVPKMFWQATLNWGRYLGDERCSH